MSKSNDSKKRKSGFNPNRTCYLTADGKFYCYERWDDDAKRVVTQRLEVGKDLSLELTIMLVSPTTTWICRIAMRANCAIPCLMRR